MLVSTKGRYALRVIVDLAEHASEEMCIRDRGKAAELITSIWGRHAIEAEESRP